MNLSGQGRFIAPGAANLFHSFRMVSVSAVVLSILPCKLIKPFVDLGPRLAQDPLAILAMFV